MVYEGAHRVPYVVRWPGKMKPGSVNESVICLNDLMATGSNFSLMSRTGTEFQRFAPHVMGYLLRRVIYDEGRAP